MKSKFRGAIALLCSLTLAGPACALTFQQALALAEQQSPGLTAQGASIASAESAGKAALSLPDPRLSVGVENFPIGGPERFSLTRDFMTMTRIGLMQEVPNLAKRQAREQIAQAKAQRERGMLTVARLQLRQSFTRAWLAVGFAQQRQRALGELVQENQRLASTLASRIAAGTAQAADMLMARQEALALEDRRDDLAREEAKARSALRRFIGERASEPLQDGAPVSQRSAREIREQVHAHAEVTVYQAMASMAQAEVNEAQADAKGDWSWEVAYSRRGPQWGDMLSFQVSMDLPWQKDRRQNPLIAARQNDVRKVEAERAELERRHGQEIDEQLAELQALDSQRQRLHTRGQKLAQDRVALAMGSYQAGREGLGMVLTARRELLEVQMRMIEIDAQRADLRARLDNLIAE